MPFYHATSAENLSSILARGLEPRIGARSRMIGEEVPAVYLFQTMALLEDAIGGWLGDAFEEAGIESAALLAVNLSPELEARLICDGFSHSSSVAIPADSIQHIRTETLAG